MKFILTRWNINVDSVNIFLIIRKCDKLLKKYYKYFQIFYCALPNVCEKFTLFAILKVFNFPCKDAGMFPRFSIKKRLYKATQVVEPLELYVV